jgi:hypothetical protein
MGCFENVSLIGVGVSCGVPGPLGGTCRIWAYVAPFRRRYRTYMRSAKTNVPPEEVLASARSVRSPDVR